MGGIVAKVHGRQTEEQTLDKVNSTVWKVVPASDDLWKKMISEGTFEDTKPLSDAEKAQLLELRTILEDTVGQKILGAFAKSKQTHTPFFCWAEILEYKEIPTAEYRRGMALHLYSKYVKDKAVLQITGVDPAEIARIGEAISKVKAGGDERANILTVNLFDKLLHQCFMNIYYNTFVPFVATEDYAELVKTLRSTYNRVVISDFEYISRLGEGGFGRVMHVKKKSTGKDLAMKVQLKTGMTSCYRDDLTRIDHERRVLSCMHHPFIVGIHYAFQTETLAIMVLDLVTGGDLLMALKTSNHGRLEEIRVQFYAAEIILALRHLHSLGLMYRDLKPGNVLLCDDGHIKLADMGGVAKFANGTCLDSPSSSLADKKKVYVEIGHGKTLGDTTTPTSAEMPLSEVHRRRSIMGTHGYMAPEMVVHPKNRHASRTKGYGAAVDFWSLGVMMFKLLTGARPFTDDNFQKFVDAHSCPQEQSKVVYQELVNNLPFPAYMGESARSVIKGLLREDVQRLGSTPALMVELQKHSFFSNIDWNRLSVRNMIPPHIEQHELITLPQYKNFDDIMCSFEEDEFGTPNEEKAKMWRTLPTPEDDKAAFSDWDFVSMHTLKIELGIANECEEYDRNFKVRQLMGEPEKETHALSLTRVSSLTKSLTRIKF